MPGSQEAAAARGARILLVEDDEDTAGFVALALGGEGYRVTSVASSEEALEKLETQAFDLMLVDLTLPGMNGAELCGRIKADPGRSHVPVYLFTARAEVSAREEARAANCDGYLIKPIGVPDLLARIQGALAANKGR